MKLTILAAAMLVAFNSYAANGGEGNNSGCNGQGNVNSPCVPGSNGSASSSFQDQQQAQSQTQFATGGYSNADATAANLNNSITNSSASGGHASVGNTTAAGGQATSNSNSNANNHNNNIGNTVGSSTTNVNYNQEAQARDPVSTAYAPTIATGNDQCLVAVSGGVQAVGFGVSLGSAVPDKNCENIKLFRILWTVGLQRQAVVLLSCNDERVRKVVGIPKEICDEFK